LGTQPQAESESGFFYFLLLKRLSYPPAATTSKFSPISLEVPPSNLFPYFHCRSTLDLFFPPPPVGFFFFPPRFFLQLGILFRCSREDVNPLVLPFFSGVKRTAVNRSGPGFDRKASSGFPLVRASNFSPGTPRETPFANPPFFPAFVTPHIRAIMSKRKPLETLAVLVKHSFSAEIERSARWHFVLMVRPFGAEFSLFVALQHGDAWAILYGCCDLDYSFTPLAKVATHVRGAHDLVCTTGRFFFLSVIFALLSSPLKPSPFLGMCECTGTWRCCRSAAGHTDDFPNDDLFPHRLRRVPSLFCVVVPPLPPPPNPPFCLHLCWRV